MRWGNVGTLHAFLAFHHLWKQHQLMRRVLSRLKSAGLARGFTTLHGFCTDRHTSKALASRVISSMFSRQRARAVRTWCQHAKGEQDAETI